MPSAFYLFERWLTLDEKIIAFRKEAEIIEKRFKKFFESMPALSGQNPDNIHNHYALYNSDAGVLLIFSVKFCVDADSQNNKLQEAYHRIFG